MGMFLNSKVPYEIYKNICMDTYFVDKTDLLNELLPVLDKENRFICITRPRRFGKSVMACMVGAFFGRAEDGNALFKSLKISKNEDASAHLNKHQVIYIDFSDMPEKCTSYDAYISRVLSGLRADLMELYPEDCHRDRAVWDIFTSVFQRTGDKFIFVIDEWDAIFHLPFITETEKKTYLLFLKNLLKGKPYVELAYMTGVLPISKYSSGLELNMFLEYDMATKKRFSEYFGFLDTEVDGLYRTYLQNTEEPEISREDLRIWYDGYYVAKGMRIYNPRSVICALSENELSNYWTSSGPYDEIFFYIRNNVDTVRDDLVLMASGESIPVSLQGYAAADTELKNKNQIYSAMVVYGLLTYVNKSVSIPNKELMDKYNELLLSNEHLGYVHRLALKSDKMLQATLQGDTKTMAEILEYAHDTETPILSYNNEVELSAIVNLIYLSARDRYRVEREDKAGEGFVDFIFYPEIRNETAIILELKVDGTPEEAIEQIKEKRYALRFKGKLGERSKYTGKILAVGIGYRKKKKEHTCKVEELRV